jgi:hypothetical protein
MNTVTRSFVVQSMIFGALVLISACSHQPKRVDCGNRLEPINAATPAAAKNSDDKVGEP